MKKDFQRETYGDQSAPPKPAGINDPVSLDVAVESALRRSTSPKPSNMNDPLNNVSNNAKTRGISGLVGISLLAVTLFLAYVGFSMLTRPKRNSATVAPAQSVPTSSFIEEKDLTPQKLNIGNFSISVQEDPVRGKFTFVSTGFVKTLSNSGSAWKYQISFRCMDDVPDIQIISPIPMGQESSERLFYYKFINGEPSGGVYWNSSTQGDSVFLPAELKNSFFVDALSSDSLTIRKSGTSPFYDYNFSTRGFREAAKYLYCFS